MKRKQVLFAILLYTMLLNSCDLFKSRKKDNYRDAFYSNKGGFDRPRIPLIKPYELLKVGAEWRMELLTTDLLALSATIGDRKIPVSSDDNSSLIDHYEPLNKYLTAPSRPRRLGFLLQRPFFSIYTAGLCFQKTRTSFTSTFFRACARS